MKRWLRIIAVPIWLSLGAALLWFALKQVDRHDLLESLTGVAILPLLGALVVDILSVASKATKWHMLLRPLGKVTLYKLQGSIYAGGAVSMVLPFRLDEAVRAFVASRFSGIPIVSIFGSMALERLVDVCVLLGFVLSLTLILPLPPIINSAVLVASAMAGVLVAMLVVGHIFSSRDWLKGVLAKLMDRFAEGSRALMRPQLVLAAMVFSAGEWFLTGSVIALVCEAASVPLPPGGMVLATTLLFTSFALPLAPAGIGVYQVACELVLPPIYGISKVQAVTMALLVHMLLLAPMATIGSTVIILAGVRLSDLKRPGGDEGGEGGEGGEGA